MAQTVKCSYTIENVTKARRLNTTKVSQSHLDKLTKARAIAGLFPTRQRADVVKAIMAGMK